MINSRKGSQEGSKITKMTYSLQSKNRDDHHEINHTQVFFDCQRQNVMALAGVWNSPAMTQVGQTWSTASRKKIIKKAGRIRTAAGTSEILKQWQQFTKPHLTPLARRALLRGQDPPPCHPQSSMVEHFPPWSAVVSLFQRTPSWLQLSQLVVT